MGTRALRGSAIGLLVGVANYLVAGLAVVILTKIFPPSIFGAYAVVAALSVAIYTLMSGGVVTAYIRERDLPQSVIHTTTTLFLMVGGAVASLVLLASFVAVDAEGPRRYYLWAAASFILLSSFRLPNLVLSHRRLLYGRLAVISLTEVLVFQGTVIGFALAGWGSTSFALGLAASGVFSAAAAFAFTPWRPAWAWVETKPYLRRALPLEANIGVQVARDQLTLPTLALLTSATVVGLYSWAFALAGLVTVFVSLASQPLTRALAELRDDKRAFQEVLSRAMRLAILSAVGLNSVLIAVFTPMTTVVFAPDWLEADKAVVILALAGVISAVSGPLFSAVVVTDEGPRRILRWELVCVALYWCIGLGLALPLGIEGMALGYLVGAVLLFVFLRSHLRGASLGLKRQFSVSLLAGLVAVGAGRVVVSQLSPDIISLLLSTTVAIAIYLALAVALGGRLLRADLHLAWSLLRGRSAL